MTGPLVGYVVVATAVLAGVLLLVAARTMRWFQMPPTEQTGSAAPDDATEGESKPQLRYLGIASLYTVFVAGGVFLFPWATVLRDDDLGLPSLVAMGIVVAILLVGLAHAVRRGPAFHAAPRASRQAGRSE